jgi:hypothetical protein
MKRLLWIVGGFWSLAAVSFGSPLPPPTIIFNNPLPTANLNQAAGAARSNFAFTEFDPNNPLAFESFDGENFTLSSSSNSYIVDSITTWSVASTLGQPLGNEFQSLALYLRPVFTDPITGAISPLAPFTLVASGSPGTSFGSDGVTVGNSNPNISSTNVQYQPRHTPSGTPPPVDYQDCGWDGSTCTADPTTGAYFPLWQNTFSNLNLTLVGGQMYEFAVWGLGYNTLCTDSDFQCVDPNSLYGVWFNEYSNAARSGPTEQQASGLIAKFDATNLGAVASYENIQQIGAGPVPVNLNFEIVGQPIPEPATMGLVGLGLVTLGVLSRKRWRRK